MIQRGSIPMQSKSMMQSDCNVNYSDRPVNASCSIMQDYFVLVHDVNTTIQQYQYIDSEPFTFSFYFLFLLFLARFPSVLVIATLCLFFGCSAFASSSVSELSEPMAPWFFYKCNRDMKLRKLPFFWLVVVVGNVAQKGPRCLHGDVLDLPQHPFVPLHEVLFRYAEYAAVAVRDKGLGDGCPSHPQHHQFRQRCCNPAV